MIPRSLLLVLVPFMCVLPALPGAESLPLADAGAPFGRLPLIDEIRCGDEHDAHEFADLPQGASRVETVLGVRARVLPAAGTAKTFAYRIGKGKHLAAGAAYVLAIEYPEDQPRTMYILNHGASTMTGVASGATLGDVLYSYTGSNPESLRYPLAQAPRTWKTLFRLHDRTFGRDGGARTNAPEDGFWVLITQPDQLKDPASVGAAVIAIRLYAVPDAAKFDATITYPPADLPRRHLFWREEMADAAITDDDPAKRGVGERVRWFEYKAQLMRFLGMNTFSKDLLEFGHNQGWDSAPYGGNDWVNQTRYPTLWRETVETVGKYGFGIMPYYEYAGSVGAKSLGREKRAIPLTSTKGYTHVPLCEKNNVDVTDPDTVEDFRKILELTIVRQTDAARFEGAWIRPRPAAMPIGFADATLARFAAEANGGEAVTRERLAGEDALRQRYYTWWYGKRRDFLIGVRDYLRANKVPDATVLFTAYASEEGPSLDGRIVTDDVERWQGELRQPGHKDLGVMSFAAAVSGNAYLDAILRMQGTWGGWEWQHAVPPADPAAYAQTEGVLMTFPFNKTYTTSAQKPLAAFRTRSGLAIIRHYALNEQAVPQEQTGYLVADVERPGPYSVAAEVRAVANGDPTYIGYMVANSFTRGFPEYARSFNAAFLALPALPSTIAEQASPVAEVVVRTIPTAKHGTYVAVANTGFSPTTVALTLPVAGEITDAVSGQHLGSGRKLTLPLGACELRSLHVK